jgi:putative ABC transport system permease protein
VSIYHGGTAKTGCSSWEWPEAEDFNRDVYIPLQTCRARYGERVFMRTGGSWTAEAVPLHRIILSVQSAEQVQPTVALITSQLRHTHAQHDGEVQAPGEQPGG